MVYSYGDNGVAVCVGNLVRSDSRYSDASENDAVSARKKEQAGRDESDYYFASYSHYGIHEDMLKVCAVVYT